MTRPTRALAALAALARGAAAGFTDLDGALWTAAANGSFVPAPAGAESHLIHDGGACFLFANRSLICEGLEPVHDAFSADCAGDTCVVTHYNASVTVVTPSGATASEHADDDVSLGVGVGASGGDLGFCYVAWSGALVCEGYNVGHLWSASEPETAQGSAEVLPAAADIVSVTMHAAHRFAFARDSTVYAWGHSENNILLDGDASDHEVTSPEDVGSYTEFASAPGFTCHGTGTDLRCAGPDSPFTAGEDGSTLHDVGTATDLKIVYTAAGAAHACYRDDESRVCVGDGLAWPPAARQERLAARAPEHPNCGMTAFGTDHMCLVTSSGQGVADQVICGGDAGDAHGEDDARFPEPVRAVAAGDGFSCALSGGRVYCWGSNDRGIFGHGGLSTSVAQLQPHIEGARALVCGGPNCCVRTDDDDVRCWGDNSRLQLGARAPGRTMTPVSVRDLADGGYVEHVALGDVGSVCLVSNGQTYCSGQHSDLRESGVRQAALGDEYACVLRRNDTIGCFGPDEYHNLIYDVPELVARDVQCAGHNCCALVINGDVVCWGEDYLGARLVYEGAAAFVMGPGDFCAHRANGDGDCMRHRVAPGCAARSATANPLAAADCGAGLNLPTPEVACALDARGWARCWELASFRDVSEWHDLQPPAARLAGVGCTVGQDSVLTCLDGGETIVMASGVHSAECRSAVCVVLSEGGTLTKVDAPANTTTVHATGLDPEAVEAVFLTTTGDAAYTAAGVARYFSLSGNATYADVVPGGTRRAGTRLENGGLTLVSDAGSLNLTAAAATVACGEDHCHYLTAAGDLFAVRLSDLVETDLGLGDVLHLSAHDGACVIRAGGRLQCAAAGDMRFSDAARPFELLCHDARERAVEATAPPSRAPTAPPTHPPRSETLYEFRLRTDKSVNGVPAQVRPAADVYACMDMCDNLPACTASAYDPMTQSCSVYEAFGSTSDTTGHFTALKLGAVPMMEFYAESPDCADLEAVPGLPAAEFANENECASYCTSLGTACKGFLRAPSGCVFLQASDSDANTHASACVRLREDAIGEFQGTPNRSCGARPYSSKLSDFETCALRCSGAPANCAAFSYSTGGVCALYDAFASPMAHENVTCYGALLHGVTESHPHGRLRFLDATFVPEVHRSLAFLNYMAHVISGALPGDLSHATVVGVRSGSVVVDFELRGDTYAEMDAGTLYRVADAVQRDGDRYSLGGQVAGKIINPPARPEPATRGRAIAITIVAAAGSMILLTAVFLAYWKWYVGRVEAGAYKNVGL